MYAAFFFPPNFVMLRLYNKIEGLVKLNSVFHVNIFTQDTLIYIDLKRGWHNTNPPHFSLGPKLVATGG
jgi:hypothetical protein